MTLPFDAIPAGVRHCQIGRLRIQRLDLRGGRVLTRAPEPARPAAYDLVFPCDGRIGFRQGEQGGTAGVGEYVLLDRRRPYAIVPDGARDLLSLAIPAADLAQRHPGVADCVARRFGQDARMAGVLYGLLRMVTAAFGDAPPPNPEALATEIIALVALVLGAEERGAAAPEPSSRRRLRARILRFIDGNLHDAELSPRAVARANGISLSYLYNLFRDSETTVARLIQARRLQKAHEILLADTQGALQVSEVAYHVGFKNPSHFSRSFSQRYQMAPRDLRQQRRAGAETAAAWSPGLEAPPA